ncbi:GNAT family N-acetyltransferase [Cryptosporangium aurantiacum]|uniref:Acetyltransferase (GNAT) family protein n=1 Tax=Cryptosporangium aurantiacum TaxID=134849 RepID=A0A1M7RJ75_9ACTN|nr:GNAT family N-acetyltransferase [Cryptosporangium aurantiacum]SHN46246.1 Acetyltransferase (GNAT) family protein [Cryptosporangium aurantiacum]
MEPKITLGRLELIDELEDLWLALHAHHQEGLPGFAYHPPATSWRNRRAQYHHWLAHPQAFVLVAYDGPTPVGYALVEVIEGPEDTWVTGDRIAELQTLSVAPGWRGRGLGTLLLDRVDAELAARGIHDLLIAVLEGNDGAERFYQRRGLKKVMSTYARFSGGETPQKG